MNRMEAHLIETKHSYVTNNNSKKGSLPIRSIPIDALYNGLEHKIMNNNDLVSNVTSLNELNHDNKFTSQIKH